MDDAKRTILIIIGEDGGVSNLLITLGFRPVIAGPPSQAVARIKNTAWALVLLNVPGREVKPGITQELCQEECPILLVADASGPATPSPHPRGSSGSSKVPWPRPT